MSDKANIVRLFIGAAIFGAGFIVKNMALSGIVSFTVFLAAYLILGHDIILRALRNLTRGQIFDENFLMSLATIGAFIIGETPEAAGVMLFYQIGEYFQDRAVKKSKKSISDLMDIRPDYANLIKEGETVKTAPATVCIGDLILIKPGEKIPLDGVVTEGSSMIDTSALTGESVPRKAAVSSAVLSGCVNMTGALTVKVTKTFGESTVLKIINLVENAAGRKAKTENFITKFARVYTPVVVILAVLLAFIPPFLLGGELKEWINRALVFLVISCPCALVLSIPMGFFAGIGRAAKNGILVKGGNYLEAFSRLDTVIFDKTGTLTKGVFTVTSMQNAGNFSESELLKLVCYAESFSNHPIALSVNEHLARSGGSIENERAALTDYAEIAGLGVSVKLNGKTVLAGNQKLMEEYGIKYEESPSGGTKVYAAYDGEFAGCIVISDEVKRDSKSAICALKERGVRRTVMLTGDNPLAAQEAAAGLGIDEVYAGLLPHEKVEMTEKIKLGVRAGEILAFVGDGINDAPVLAMADVGVAMGELGSDAAIEAADAVLMTDEPSKLALAIDISRLTGKIVRQNIVFSLGIKAVFLALGVLSIASMWEAVFADVGVSLLAVLNAMRIIQKPLFFRKTEVSCKQ